MEDNPDLRNFLQQSLHDTYRVSTAENGKKALEQINQQQPDLIISDIMMPIMRGDELCQTLKGNMETSHIPVILLTALGDRESILRGLEIKADNYVVKPFDMDILKANIASVLANKEYIRQRFAQLNYQTEDLPQEIKQAPGLNLDQEFLIKVTELVKKNLDKEFNVDDLCMEMGMGQNAISLCPASFCNKFILYQYLCFCDNVMSHTRKIAVEVSQSNTSEYEDRLAPKSNTMSTSRTDASYYSLTVCYLS